VALALPTIIRLVFRRVPGSKTLTCLVSLFDEEERNIDCMIDFFFNFAPPTPLLCEETTFGIDPKIY
jgi:hypothetical protein